MAIKFYRTRDEYGAFSNFAKYPVEIDGKVWPTTEHYYQAMKFVNVNAQEAIRNLDTPKEAASAGRSSGFGPIKEDWDVARIGVMFVALTEKFKQHPALAELLLSTGHEVIVEHTVNDRFWGDAGDGTGQNMLGTLLMLVRENLRK